MAKLSSGAESGLQDTLRVSAVVGGVAAPYLAVDDGGPNGLLAARIGGIGARVTDVIEDFADAPVKSAQGGHFQGWFVDYRGPEVCLERNGPYVRPKHERAFECMANNEHIIVRKS